ncbi:2-C-methyl-D-erythritol 4-phosphate cytidylyltransferase [Brevibacterium salitolerans]|uniref:2-C-methyl-D-erythritol 4-phosphate cytidylyltransferase n=1 Tax=Brevibacterium salitolerans TaxID=1403566 RepID=A0ABN2WIH3_9MICO
MRTALLVPAAGSGTRLGAARPKAFVPLAGRPLLWHALRGAVRTGAVDAVVIAAPDALIGEAARIAAEAVGEHPCAVEVVPGADDRAGSVAAALAAVPSAEHVLVHDAARCLTPPAVHLRVLRALRAGAEAVVPVLPVTDTVRTVEAGLGTPTSAGGELLAGSLDRSALRRVQTPQGFSREVLFRAHALHHEDPDPAATDDAGLAARLGAQVVGVPGDESALKITYPLDLRIAALLLEDPQLFSAETPPPDPHPSPQSAQVPLPMQNPLSEENPS